jgi:Cysteine-rich CPXCG
MMQNTSEYFCAYCGEANITFVDFSAGSHQSYIEDCQVCCQPNVLFIQIDEETLDIEITSEPEN